MHPPIRIQRVSTDAILPTKDETDLAWDIYCVADEEFREYIYREGNPSGFILYPGHKHMFHTGIKVVLPFTYGAILRSRSGLGSKGIQVLAGVIDEGYRGEWLVVLHNCGIEPVFIQPGDRIAQAILVERINTKVIEVDELDETARGEQGFGASGR